MTFAADRLAVDEHRAGIEVNPVPREAESFADAATGGDQKGQKIRYVVFLGVFAVRDPREQLARLKDTQGSRGPACRDARDPAPGFLEHRSGLHRRTFH